MILRELSIEAFGVWKGLRLGSLTPGLNVFYGPNEAGKTTVLQFVRSMFYGFTPERRRRYLPPVGGGQGGGRLELEVQGRRFRLERFEEEGFPLGRLVLRDDEGGAPPPQVLEQWLGGLEDKLYTHVFALELDELQELGTLSDLDAARRFYELSVGLGDVRLEAVLESLRDDRKKRLGTPEERARIQELIAQRRTLRGQLDRHRPDLDAEHSLTASQREIEARIAADETRIGDLEAQLKRLEGLAAVEGLLRQRERLQARIDELRQTRRLSPQAASRLEQLEKRLAERRKRKEASERDARKLRADAEKIGVQAQWKGRRREVEALAGQLPWLEALEQRSADWRKEVARCEAELVALRKQTGATPSQTPATVQSANAAQNANAGKQNPNARNAAAPSGGGQLLGAASPYALPTPSSAPQREAQSASAGSSSIAAADAAALLSGNASEAAWEQVRPLAAKAISARSAYRKHQVRAKKRREAASAAAQRIASGLPEATHRDLELAWEEVARHVELMHERIQLEHRVSQLHQDYQEAAARGAELIDSQVMPSWTLYGLAGLFTFGLMLLTASFLIPSWFSSQWGWLLSLAGLGGLALAGAVNYAWQRAAEFRLEKAQHQAEGLSAAIVQLQEEQRRIDLDLPPSNVDLHERLAQAEEEKAQLEQMLPLATQRKSLRSKAQSAVKKARDARTRMKEAVSAFRAAVKTHGLPENVLPTQIQSLGRSMQQAAQLQGRAQLFRQEIERHQVLVDRLRGQVQQLFKELGQTAPQDLKAGLEKLSQQLKERSERLGQRRKLMQKHRALRRREQWHGRVLTGLEKAKKKRLASWGVSSAAEAAKLTERLAEARAAREQFKSLAAPLKEAARGLGGLAAAQAELAALVGGPAQARSALEADLKAAREALQNAYQELGRLEARSEAPADDQLRDELRRQLDAVETELRAACEAWQGLALAEALLDSVRVDFEEHRQPRTLVQASEYLQSLSDGAYVKLRSTLADRTLFVEDSEGRLVAVEKLSRGARELLYLALRLAIVDDYAEKGVRLPVVLDDLFVNFDERRTQAAARLLVDFARRGRQVLVLTCHGHTANYFQDQGVHVRGLPSRDPESGLPNSEAGWADLPNDVPTAGRSLSAAAAAGSKPWSLDDADRTPGWSETRLDRILRTADEPDAAEDARDDDGRPYSSVPMFDGDALDDDSPSVIEAPETVVFPAPPAFPPGMEGFAPRGAAGLLGVEPPPHGPPPQDFSSLQIAAGANARPRAAAGEAAMASSASAAPSGGTTSISFSTATASPDSIWWSHEMQIGDQDSAPAVGSGLVQVEEVGGAVVAGSSPEHAPPVRPAAPPALELRSASAGAEEPRKKLRRPTRPRAELHLEEESPKPAAEAPARLRPTRDVYALADDPRDSEGDYETAPPPAPIRRIPAKDAAASGDDPRARWWRLGAWPVESTDEPSSADRQGGETAFHRAVAPQEEAVEVEELEAAVGWTPVAPAPLPTAHEARPARALDTPAPKPTVRPVRTLQPRLYAPEVEEIVVEADEPPAVRYIDVPLDAFLGAASPAAAAAEALSAEAPFEDDDLELDVEFDAAPELEAAAEPAEAAPPPTRRPASERRSADAKKRKKKRPMQRRRVDPPPAEPTPPPPPAWRTTQIDTSVLRWNPPASAPSPRRPTPPRSGGDSEDVFSWAEWGGPPGEDR